MSYFFIVAFRDFLPKTLLRASSLTTFWELRVQRSELFRKLWSRRCLMGVNHDHNHWLIWNIRFHLHVTHVPFPEMFRNKRTEIRIANIGDSRCESQKSSHFQLPSCKESKRFYFHSFSVCFGCHSSSICSANALTRSPLRSQDISFQQFSPLKNY